jgi:hypothetical protein
MVRGRGVRERTTSWRGAGWLELVLLSLCLRTQNSKILNRSAQSSE